VGATVLLIVVSLVLGAGAWLLFLWAVRSDQYDDVERPKHRMLDEEPAPPPKPPRPRGTLKGESPPKEGDAG
jgi:cbb3-type cytochrome oxidase maturation protein